MFTRMAHEELTDDLREHLTLYILDMLPPELAAGVARHLEQHCAVCETELKVLLELTATLAFGTQVAYPPETLRKRVLSSMSSETRQVWKDWQCEGSGTGVLTVRRDEGSWHTVAPGVSVRRLYVDRERNSVTMMIRMEPGATYSPHVHAGPEQCFVLEGDISDGRDTFRAGDFQCAPKGSTHGVQQSERGCLLLIVSSLGDKLVG